MKLPHLSKDSRLPAILKKLNLNISYALYDENKNHISRNQVNDKTIVEISSSVRLGKSEVSYSILKKIVKNYQGYFEIRPTWFHPG